jgi:hypothetical protein
VKVKVKVKVLEHRDMFSAEFGAEMFFADRASRNQSLFSSQLKDPGPCFWLCS